MSSHETVAGSTNGGAACEEKRPPAIDADLFPPGAAVKIAAWSVDTQASGGDKGCEKSPKGWPSALPGYDSRQQGEDPIQQRALGLCKAGGVSAWLTENNALLVGAAIVVALSFADLVLRFTAPCAFNDLAFDAVCRQRQVVVHWVGIAKYIAGVSPFLCLVLLKLLRILRLQQDRIWFRWLSWLPTVKGPLPSNHWSIVATRSFYEGSVQSVKMLHLLVVLVQLPSVVFTFQQVAEGVMLYLSGFEGSPDCQAVGAEDDSRFNTLQCQGRIWRFLAIQVAWEVCIVPLSILIVTPDMMWAPGVQKAAAMYKDVSVQRFAVLPWALLPATALLTINTFLFWSVLWDEVAEGHGTVVIVHFIVCIICCFTGLAVLIWSRVLQESFSLIFQQAKLSLRRSSYDDIEDQSARQRLKWDLTRHDYRKALLIQIIYLFVSYAGNRVVNIAIFTVLRGLVLVLLFLGKERESRFNELQDGEPALGLLIGAKELCRALMASQAGKLWDGPLPMYQGTVVRMQTTLAVSYKWHRDEIQITKRHWLNMSDFQIQALIKGIKATCCDYVWVDRLAVPQERSQLQNTLLSRMLIVYASCQATLAIRTQESKEELRYHRRAWTLQEFCCAYRLYVETEGSVPSGIISSANAATLQEERFFDMLRGGLQKSLRECQPLWLCDMDEYVTVERAKHVIEMYSILAPLLFCEDGADKLRALCPLLACIPVEGHKQLLLLIDCLKERAGVEWIDEVGEKLLVVRASSRSAWSRLTFSYSDKRSIVLPRIHEFVGWIRKQLPSRNNVIVPTDDK